MPPDTIRQVAVVGAGLMGHGIAQEFALAGYEVGLHDISDSRLDHALTQIREDLHLSVELGLTDAVRAAEAPPRIHPNTDLPQVVRHADLVIEAIIEDLQVKQRVFQNLDQLCQDQTILASNSSSFMPSQLAVCTQRPDKVLVTHYFNPPHLLPLVEVVRGPATSDATVSAVVDLLSRIGKRPALVQREVPGFVGNRLQIALLREAASLVEQGIASPQDIDVVIKYGFGRRLAAAGVFEIFDIAGWDLVLTIMTNLLPHIASSPELPQGIKDKVMRGELGVKTGQGYYPWTPESAAALKQRIARSLVACVQLSAIR